MRRLRLWFIFVGCLVLALPLLVLAQENRLVNGTLDEGGSFGPYTTRRGGEFPIYLPNGWNYWLAPQSGEFLNRGDRTTINPHPGPGPSPTNGTRAVNVDCGFVTCTVAIYQQVPVEAEQNIQASAWAQVKACNIPEDANNCGSARESGARTRIGIDPNGGTNPTDSDILWSNWVEPHDQWLEMQVSATTTGTTATLFLYSTQANVAQINRTYWDDARLSGGGAGGVAEGVEVATPVPTAPPSVAFVVPQEEQDDGSIVHVVREGDTIDSIAVAYGLSREDILELNNIVDPRIIRVGQEIVIREPIGAAEDEEDAETAAGDDEPAAETTEPAEPDEAADPDPVEPTAEEPSAEEPDTQESAGADPTEEVVAEDSEPMATAQPAPVVSVADGGVVPASDPSTQFAAVCIELFDDLNQNRIREDGEDLLSGGTVNLLVSGETLDTAETEAGDDPICFDEMSPGTYTVAANPPDGYGLTSPDQYRIQAVPGTPLAVSFGAAQGVEAFVPPPADTGGLVSDVAADQPDTRGPLDLLIDNAGLIVFGLAGLVLVSGLGLSLVLRRR